MIVLLFSAILVGMPMAVGVHAVVANVAPHDVRIGAAAIIYAVMLAGVFVILLPEGKNLTANFQFKMPAAVAVGALIGLVSGLRRRSGK